MSSGKPDHQCQSRTVPSVRIDFASFSIGSHVKILINFTFVCRSRLGSNMAGRPMGEIKKCCPLASEIWNKKTKNKQCLSYRTSIVGRRKGITNVRHIARAREETITKSTPGLSTFASFDSRILIGGSVTTPSHTIHTHTIRTILFNESNELFMEFISISSPASSSSFSFSVLCAYETTIHYMRFMTSWGLRLTDNNRNNNNISHVVL